MWNLRDKTSEGLTFLPLSDGPPTARRESTGDLFKVDVIVPILIKGVKQACNKTTTQILLLTEPEAKLSQKEELEHLSSSLQIILKFKDVNPIKTYIFFYKEKQFL